MLMTLLNLMGASFQISKLISAHPDNILHKIIIIYYYSARFPITEYFPVYLAISQQKR